MTALSGLTSMVSPIEPVNVREFGEEAFTRVGKRLSQVLRHSGAMSSIRYCCPCDTGVGRGFPTSWPLLLGCGVAVPK
jgi:hypothetical protein